MKTQIGKAEEKELDEIARIYAEEFSKPPYNESWTNGKAEKNADGIKRNKRVDIAVKKPH